MNVAFLRHGPTEWNALGRMPDNVAQKMTPQQLADLIAYMCRSARANGTCLGAVALSCSCVLTTGPPYT